MKQSQQIYIRTDGLTVGGVTTSQHPDALDDLGAAVWRRFQQAWELTVCDIVEDETVDTDDLPPLG